MFDLGPLAEDLILQPVRVEPMTFSALVKLEPCKRWCEHLSIEFLRLTISTT